MRVMGGNSDVYGLSHLGDYEATLFSHTATTGGLAKLLSKARDLTSWPKVLKQ